MKSNLLSRLNGNPIPLISSIICSAKSCKNGLWNAYYSLVFKKDLEKINRLMGSGESIPNQSNKKIVLCEVTSHLGMSSRVSYVSKIVADHLGASILFCSFNDKDSLGWLTHSISQNSLSVNISRYNKRAIEKAKSDARAIYNSLKEPKDLFDVHYEGVFIGDLIYDQVMRFGKWQASVWEINEKVLYTLEKNLVYIAFYKAINHQFDVVSAVGSHTVGVISTLQRYFSSLNVPSYLPYNAILKYTEFNGSRLPYYVDFPTDLIENILSNEKVGRKLLKEADAFIEYKFTGKAVFDIDSPRAFSTKKKIYTDANDFCITYGLENKPCVFIMLHAFNDHPHHFEDGIFLDYYIWFKETLDFIATNQAVNWIIKEHPTSELYPMDISVGEMIAEKGNNSILFLDADSLFNTASVKSIAHCVLTAIGTAGLENACFGIPCVITGPNHYSGHGIAIEPKTKQEYFNLLGSIHENPQISVLDERTIDKARVLYYLAYSYIYGQSGDVTQIVARNVKNPGNQDKRMFIKDLINNLKRFEAEGLRDRIEAFIESSDHTLYIDPNLREDLNALNT